MRSLFVSHACCLSPNRPAGDDPDCTLCTDTGIGSCTQCNVLYYLELDNSCNSTLPMCADGSYLIQNATATSHIVCNTCTSSIMYIVHDPLQALTPTATHVWTTTR